MNAYFKAGFASLLAVGLIGTSCATTLEVSLPPPGSFTTIIDNSYMPLPAGTSFAYLAETEDGCEYNKLSVTSDTKNVNIGGNNYSTLIIRDQAWESEDCDVTTATLAEDTNDFLAMEALSQNVWYFGEETWAIDEESADCTDEGAWVAGVDDAEPGIIMLGNPHSGDRYQQEFSEDNAEDWGAVLRLNATVSIGYGEFENCLVTREWTPLSPGNIEHKYYCPETGNPGPGLMFIEELKEKTVKVEFIGMNLTLGAPGEFTPFPAMDDVGSCNIP